mgnify:CR=1 FL=1
MVAAVLHLEERAGVILETVDAMELRGRRRHDVAD